MTPAPTAQHRCRGDIDGDGRITARDILLELTHVLATRGREPSSERYDVNDDGRIDIGDVWALVKRLGHHCIGDAHHHANRRRF